MSFIRQVAHNTLIQIIGKIASTFLGLLVVVVMARYLGVAGFGDYTSSMAYVQFAAVLADFGLTLALLRLLSLPNVDEKKVIGNVFTFRLFTALVLFVIALIISFFLPYSRVVKIGIFISVFAFIFSALQNVLTSVFQKKLLMYKTVLAENFGRLLLLIGVLLVVYFDFGLLCLLGVVVLGSLGNFYLTYYFAQKMVKFSWEFDFFLWRKIFQTTWPIGLSIAFNLVYFKLDTVVMSLFRSSAETGIYGATYKVLEILISLPFMFLGLMVPMMTVFWHNREKEKFFKIVQQSFDFMAITSLPLVFGVFFLAEKIMVLVAGPDFLPAGPVLRLLIVATAIIFLSNVFTHAIVAIDAQKKILWSFFASAVLGAIGYFVFIPLYSYWGAAWVTILVEAQVLVSSFLLIRHLTSFSLGLKVFIKSLLASFVMSGCLFLTMSFNIFFQVIIAMVVYFGAILLLKAVSVETLKEIFRLKKSQSV